MDRVPYEVRLSGPGDFGRDAPPEPVGRVLTLTGPTVRRAILMRFVGRSEAKSRAPRWLDRAADIRFVGMAGGDRGETVLRFEAPRLGEAAGELYRQPEFWPSRPDGDDTGFDLLGDLLGDVAGHRADSELFDAPFLHRLGQFGRAFGAAFDRAALAGHRIAPDRPAVLDRATIASARQLDDETPPPQRVRVAGTLDMVRLSGSGFELILDDGTRARGILVRGEIDALVPLAGRRVLIQGEAVYRPSGRLLRLDAREVEPGPDAPGLWSRIPPPRRRKLDPRTLRRPQAPSGGVSAFYGTWPGEETEEEWGAIVEGLG